MIVLCMICALVLGLLYGLSGAEWGLIDVVSRHTRESLAIFLPLCYTSIYCGFFAAARRVFNQYTMEANTEQEK